MTFMYLYIFLQSNLLEVPFYYFFYKKDFDLKKILTTTTAINSLTHPIVFFVIMNLKNTYLTNILFAEFFAVITESLFFYFFLNRSYKKAFMASFIANLISWQLAPMMTYLILSSFL